MVTMVLVVSRLRLKGLS